MDLFNSNRSKSRYRKKVENHSIVGGTKNMNIPNISYLDRLNNDHQQKFSQFGDNDEKYFYDNIEMKDYIKLYQDLDNLKKWFGFVIIFLFLFIFVQVRLNTILFIQNQELLKEKEEMNSEINIISNIINDLSYNYSILKEKLIHSDNFTRYLEDLIKASNITYNRKFGDIESNMNKQNQKIEKQFNISEKTTRKIKNIKEKQKMNLVELRETIKGINQTFMDIIRNKNIDMDEKFNEISKNFTRYVDDKINDMNQDFDGKNKSFAERLIQEVNNLKLLFEKYQRDTRNKNILKDIINSLGLIISLGLHFV